MTIKVTYSPNKRYVKEADTLLRALISEYSERGWCAGWMMDIDKKIFKLIQSNYSDLINEEDADLLCAIKSLAELYDIFPSYTKTYSLDGYVKYLNEGKPIPVDQRLNPLLTA